MRNWKVKLVIFVLGLTIGLLIAGVFFMLKLDNEMEELKMANTSLVEQRGSNQTTNIINQTNDTTSEVSTKKQHTIIKIDTVHISKKTVVLTTDTIIESRTNPSSEEQSILPEESVIVKQDQLIDSKNIQITHPQTSPEQKKTDSLLQRISGIRDDSNIDSETVVVELWASPLNYNGFRMSKNKLVLYGLLSIENIKLYTINNITFMKVSKRIYQLNYTDDFTPYRLATAHQLTLQGE